MKTLIQIEFECPITKQTYKTIFPDKKTMQAAVDAVVARYGTSVGDSIICHRYGKLNIDEVDVAESAADFLESLENVARDFLLSKITDAQQVLLGLKEPERPKITVHYISDFEGIQGIYAKGLCGLNSATGDNFSDYPDYPNLTLAENERFCPDCYSLWEQAESDAS